MEQLLLVFYVLLSAGIVGLILLQQGRGADMGASFGAGASQTVFGSAGAGNLLTRSTAILATLFFVASVGLAMMAKDKAETVRDGSIVMPPPVESRDNAPVSTDEVPRAPETSEQPAASAEFPVAAPEEAAPVDAAPQGEVPAQPAEESTPPGG